MIVDREDARRELELQLAQRQATSTRPVNYGVQQHPLPGPRNTDSHAY